MTGALAFEDAVDGVGVGPPKMSDGVTDGVGKARQPMELSVNGIAAVTVEVQIAYFKSVWTQL